MKKNDLTLLFLTMNLVPWQEFHRQKLLEVIGDYPLITFSRLPMDLPGLQFRQSAEQSHEKIYRLMLEGAKIATTDYIAMVEDDMFYSKEHFEIRPPDLQTFGYNWNRWSLFTFGEPTFSFKRRYCNGCSILPRLELIDALEERFSKHSTIPHILNGELGYAKVEKNLGVTVRKSVELYSKVPVVQIHHVYGTPGIGVPASQLKPGDTLDLEKRKTRKKMGMMRAYEIPGWGRSEEFIKHFV